MRRTGPGRSSGSGGGPRADPRRRGRPGPGRRRRPGHPSARSTGPPGGPWWTSRTRSHPPARGSARPGSRGRRRPRRAPDRRRAAARRCGRGSASPAPARPAGARSRWPVWSGWSRGAHQVEIVRPDAADAAGELDGRRAAAGLGVGAAFGEVAACRPRRGVGDLPRDGGQALPGRGRLGQGPDERLGVGVAGVGEELVHARPFHDLAGVHDGHVVGDLGHDAEVVGHEDHGHAQFVAQGGQQVQDLGLDGDVQRGGGLVGQQDTGLADQGHGDHGPLAHAAGELVGIGAGPGRRVGDLHPLEGLDGGQHRRPSTDPLVDQDHLGDLVAHGERGVQAGVRLLEDHGHLLAADRPQGTGGEVDQLPTVEADRPRGDATRAPGEQAHEGQRRDRLSAAALADEGQRATGGQSQVDALDHPDPPVAPGELDGQVPDLQQLVAVGPRNRGGPRPRGAGHRAGPAESVP